MIIALLISTVLSPIKHFFGAYHNNSYIWVLLVPYNKYEVGILLFLIYSRRNWASEQLFQLSIATKQNISKLTGLKQQFTHDFAIWSGLDGDSSSTLHMVSAGMVWLELGNALPRGVTNMVGNLALSNGSSAGTTGEGPHLSSTWSLQIAKLGFSQLGGLRVDFLNSHWFLSEHKHESCF